MLIHGNAQCHEDVNFPHVSLWYQCNSNKKTLKNYGIGVRINKSTEKPTTDPHMPSGDTAEEWNTGDSDVGETLESISHST